MGKRNISDPSTLVYLPRKVYRALKAEGFDMRNFREVNPLPVMNRLPTGRYLSRH